MEDSKVLEKITVEDQLESLRKNYQKRDLIWKVTSVVSVLLPIAYFVLFVTGIIPSDLELIVYLISALVLLIIVFLCVYMLPIFLKLNKHYKEYNVKYKNTYLKPLLEDAFRSGDYDVTEKVSLKDITEMSMLKKAKSAVANDCVKGSYKGIKFSRYDLALSYGKNNDSTNCVLIACKVKTKIKGEIQIVDNQFEIGNTSYQKPEGLKLVGANRESFLKKYSVYSKDEEEAKSFVTDSLCKKLEKIKFGGQLAAFIEHDKVYAIIRRKKDVMEAPVYKKVSKTKAIKEASEEIDIIKDWVEIIHSNIED